MLGARLKLVGSCRGPSDEVRIEVLRAEAESLGIADSVDWCAANPAHAQPVWPLADVMLIINETSQLAVCSPPSHLCHSRPHPSPHHIDSPDHGADRFWWVQLSVSLNLKTACLHRHRHINVSHDELRELLAGAVGGLHTMQDEHFGISIVEYMAAGGRLSCCVIMTPRDIHVLPTCKCKAGHCRVITADYRSVRG